MKKILLPFVMFALVLSSCDTNKNEYTIEGTTPSMDAEKVFLQVLGSDWKTRELLDSTTVKDGKFSFKGTIDKPSVAYISVGGRTAKSALYKEIALEAGDIKFVNDTTLESSTTVSGTVLNESLQAFNSEYTKLSKEATTIYNELGAADLAVDAKKDLREKMAILRSKMENLQFDFIKNNINSQTGIMNLLGSSYQFGLDRLEELVKIMPAGYEEQAAVIKLNTRIEALRATKIGVQYTDLKGQDLSGKDVALSDYVGKGNYVLVDFWASWCPPCRKDMPEVVDLYKQYKGKGFEIVGISIDHEMDKWTQGTKELNVSWPQISDLKGWSSVLSNTYGVGSIPHTVLINPEGEIIARGLTVDKMTEKIISLLK